MEAIRVARDKRSGAAATIVGHPAAVAAPESWYAAFGHFLAGALLIAASGLLVRRLSGGMTSPLGAWSLVAAGLLAVIWALGARLLWWHGRMAGVGRGAVRAMRWLPTVALVIFTVAVSLEGSSIAAVVLICALIGVEEFLAGLLERGPAHKSTEEATRTAVRRTGTMPPDIVGARAIRQQFTRSRLDGERELVHGTIHVGFSTGQRTAIEHLVFCPMFATLPAMRVETLDESGGVARATHVYRYGARLEVKLSEPCDEPFEALVRYEARG
jgi:hypothetical protein